jgi:glycine betaine transporter
VFWGAAEPLSHYASPPEGIQPATVDAARAAMR